MANMQHDFSVKLIYDNTGSMGQACASARTSSAEVRAVGGLALGNQCVTISVVGDYDVSSPDNHCGGCAEISPTASNEEFYAFLNKYMKPNGGGGFPEAYKTSLNIMLKSQPVPKILFMFLDAVPHDESLTLLDTEGKKEKQYIDSNAMIWDWKKLTSAVADAGIKVVIFLTVHTPILIETWSQLGDVVIIPSNTSRVITQTMLTVFYELLGQQPDKSITYYYKENNLIMPNQIKSRTSIEPVCKINFSANLNKADPLYVIDTFKNLLDPLHPESAMALVTSPILGKYWRAICGKYRFMLDRKYEPACQEVMNRLSQCNVKLVGTDKDALKKWIDESHDDTPIIRNMTEKAMMCIVNEQYLVLPKEMAGTISLDDVLALGRDGKYSEVSKFISSLTISNDIHQMPENESNAPDFLPMNNVSLNELFSLVGNLLSPGFMFARSASFMVAILSLTNKYLSDKASEYLLINKGKWINWQLDEDKKQLFPAYWSINFIRLLQLVPHDLITKEEVEFRDHYLMVSRVIRNHDATIQIVIPFMSNVLRFDATWKRFCDPVDGGCGQFRCFTIFPGKLCGICVSTQDELVVKDIISRGIESNPSKLLEKDLLKTSWAHCYTCKGNYGITCTQHLNVRAKCHNCRTNTPSEMIECVTCLNKYLSPNGSALTAMNIALENYTQINDNEKVKLILNAKESNGFVCPRCVINGPNSMKMESSIKISALVAENPLLINLIPLTPYKTLVDSNISLWKRVLDVRHCAELNRPRPDQLFYNNFKIHNPENVVNNILDTILNHNGMTTCQMCISDVGVRNIVEACGKCPNRICNECITNWYGEVTVGDIITQNRTQCPFCKSPPKFKVIDKLSIRHIRNIRPTKQNKGVICEWDQRSIYATCSQCVKAKFALTRECARECANAAPNIRNFVCEDCQEVQRAYNINKGNNAPLTKACPICNVLVERVGGCHHITCICGAHWCWVCGSNKVIESGALFDSHSIYDHMSNCGGIFPPNHVDDAGVEGYDDEFNDY
jgi:hypothetical protein